MSPENTHKLMGHYMEVLILGVLQQDSHGFSFFKLFPIGCKGLINSLEPNDNYHVVVVSPYM